MQDDQSSTMDWKKLQNGSDIRGIALAGVEGESVNLTAEATETLARAFAAWLTEKNGKAEQAIAVGSDSRRARPPLEKACPGCRWLSSARLRHGLDTSYVHVYDRRDTAHRRRCHGYGQPPPVESQRAKVLHDGRWSRQGRHPANARAGSPAP